MKVLKKIDLEAISFCIKSAPANRLKILISKSDADKENEEAEFVDDMLGAVDAFAGEINEVMAIIGEKVNPQDLESVRRELAYNLGIKPIQKSTEEDPWPSLDAWLDEVKVEKEEEEEEEIPIKPVKTSIDDDGGLSELEEEINKTGDFVDHYPSIPDDFFGR